MKLSGPSGPGVRFVLGPKVSAVVTGVFPPELAPVVRVEAQKAADSAYPLLRAQYDGSVQRVLDEALYGTGIGEPRGILNAGSIAEGTMPLLARVVRRIEKRAPAERSPIWTGRSRSA